LPTNKKPAGTGGLAWFEELQSLDLHARSCRAVQGTVMVGMRVMHERHAL